MKDSEFRTWLDARRWRGQPLTSKAIQNRRRRLKRVERSLTAMDYSNNDIDQLIARGELPALLTKLNGYIGNREAGGPPVSLVPQAENPDGQLRNLVAVTRLYGKFANGEDPNAHDADADEVDDDQGEVGSDADDIRAAALKFYVEPARQRGGAEVSIRAGDLHDALGLDQAHANVCQALGVRSSRPWRKCRHLGSRDLARARRQPITSASGLVQRLPTRVRDWPSTNLQT